MLNARCRRDRQQLGLPWFPSRLNPTGLSKACASGQPANRCSGPAPLNTAAVATLTHHDKAFVTGRGDAWSRQQGRAIDVIMARQSLYVKNTCVSDWRELSGRRCDRQE